MSAAHARRPESPAANVPPSQRNYRGFRRAKLLGLLPRCRRAILQPACAAPQTCLSVALQNPAPAMLGDLPFRLGSVVIRVVQPAAREPCIRAVYPEENHATLGCPA